MLLAHLDFKGVLPRPETLPQLLQDLASLGYDAVLAEYEDIFPFENIDVAMHPNETWSRATLDAFVAEAARLNIEIVPLQQCLGHLEYVFRWNHLRAWALDAKYPNVLDFNNPQARAMIIEMLHQVVKAHPNSRYIHVGLDEASSLLEYSKNAGLDPLEVFLEYLDALCDECEKLGVRPVVWGDMLEDNLSPRALELLKPFASRFILCDWGYEEGEGREFFARCNGIRVARRWRDNPAQRGPAINGGTKFWEDLEEPLRELLAPHFDGETFAPLFWCDVWHSLGFEVWGTSSARVSGDFHILPDYNARCANLKAWNTKLHSGAITGHIVTSWARGTTFCPPIFSFDATWPILEDGARTAGKSVTPFFPGIDAAKVRHIFESLGRCKQDWRIEALIADEMDALAPQLKSHRWEWDGIALLARALAWHRVAAAAQDEVEYFAAADILIDSEWQRRLDEQAVAAQNGAQLKAKVHAHFAQRYDGEAFEEWVRDVFDAPMARMLAYTERCRNNVEAMRQKYQK